MQVVRRSLRHSAFLVLMILAVALIGMPVAAAGSLFPWQGIDAGPGGYAQVVRDLDGDGRADIVAAAQDGVSILFGQAYGDTSPRVRIDVGGFPEWVVVGDFNVDGVPDIAATVRLAYPAFGWDLVVLFGTGDGTFQFPVKTSLSFQPADVAAGDLNGDGRTDLIAIDRSSSTIYSYISDGLGSFRVAYGQQIADIPRHPIVADFSGDGRLDLAFLSEYGSPRFAVATGNGDGTFGDPVYQDAEAIYRFRSGDFDGDGLADVATLGNSSMLTVYYSNRDGTFSPSVIPGIEPFPFAVADYNGDGIVDLLVSGGQFGPLLALFGRTDRTFDQRHSDGSLPIGADGLSGDINGDGRADLVLPSYGRGIVTLAMGRGDGTFDGPLFLSMGESSGGPLAVGDMNGDARTDLLTLAFPDAAGGLPGLFSFLGRADFGSAAPLRTDASRFGETLLLGDFNTDGRPDAAILGLTSPALSVLSGNGDGTFGAAVGYADGAYPAGLAAGDFNGDGRIDLAITDTRFDSVSIRLQQGDGTFGPESKYTPIPAPGAVAAADLNGDGILDLVIANVGWDSVLASVTIMNGAGDGTFFFSTTLPTGFSPAAIAVADFNGDRVPDLAIGNASSGYVSIIMGLGHGSFAPQAHVQMPFDIGPGFLLTADLDSDGNEDLVAAGRSAPGTGLELFLGQGDGTFGAPIMLEVSGYMNALAVGDFNGDTRPDLAISGGSIAVLLNRGAFPDTDKDSIPDAQDPCTDTDGDGYGDPGFPANTCPIDNCPAVGNIDQGDADHDGAGDACDNCLTTPNPTQADKDKDGRGDACDTCTDTDGDGFGNPGFPASTCAPDNCPAVVNPTQSDADGDGVGDSCDNCPSVPNPSQADGDHDHVGDACDTCTDSDHDGYGDPAYPGNTCAVDNCPFRVNPNQADADHDGIGDACDPCTDKDGDGAGDCCYAASTCGFDNCPTIPNPDQTDSDGDHFGDACDTCPFDPNNDQDRDGVCGDRDTCPLVPNPDQVDGDGDRVGDACDNCPTVPNPDQSDSNQDGSGDACQPYLILLGIEEDGGDVQEVTLHAGDPQGDPLGGQIRITAEGGAIVQDLDLDNPTCDRGIFPDGYPGQGIGVANLGGDLLLFDIDSTLSTYLGLTCADGRQDFEIGDRPCGQPGIFFSQSISVPFSTQLPYSLCVRRFGATGSLGDFTILEILESTVRMRTPYDPGLTYTFDGGIPREISLSSLYLDQRYRLSITVADGSSLPVGVEATFLHQHESTMEFLGPLADSDRDGIDDAVDPCVDTDGDGFGNPGFPANTCPPDNCPLVANSGQADGDRDSVGDACDSCPAAFDPLQVDRDRDAVGDACDPCVDVDRDGTGESFEFPANTCAVDNCPGLFNPGQADQDGDGVGDACDNCPDRVNPGQEDGDGDGQGDACDPCPLDAANDSDHDGVCGDVDNCPDTANANQADADGDTFGDACDNCPGTANLDQQDSDGNGHGDACSLTVAIQSVFSQDDVLTLTAIVRSYAGGITSASVDVLTAGGAVFPINLQYVPTLNCTTGYFPYGIPGKGFGIYRQGGGQTTDFLFDIDSVLSGFRGITCEDGLQDFAFDAFPCTTGGNPGGQPIVALLSGGTACMQLVRGDHGFYSVHVEHSASGVSEQVTLNRFSPYAHASSSSGVPRQVDVSSIRGSLEPIGPFNVRLTAADLSGSGSAVQYFYYNGESTMKINLAPRAVISAPAQGKCGEPLTLDGSLSSDAEPDGSIETYRWFLDLGRPAERTLGEGRILQASLPPGKNRVGLVVFDAEGGRDSTQTLITIQDTAPPTLSCPAPTMAECAGPEGATVGVVATAGDDCSEVTITSSRGGGADASGTYPLGSTPVTFVATDAVGNVATCATSVTVRDTIPPSLKLAEDQTVLWPPNHRLVPVHVTWQAIDRCDPAPGVRLVSVVSSEPDDAPGGSDGDTSGDVADAAPGTPDDSVLLRAERSGGGPGRTYTLNYVAQDGSGNVSSAIAAVTVPHDLGSGPEPLLINVEAGGSAKSAHVFWPAVPAALSYDLIVGGLEQVTRQPDHISLGTVRVLAAGLPGTSFTENGTAPNPAPGHGYFYLVQSRGSMGTSGFGTESVPLPSQPESCEGGCPGEILESPAPNGPHKR